MKLTAFYCLLATMLIGGCGQRVNFVRSISAQQYRPVHGSHSVGQLFSVDKSALVVRYARGQDVLTYSPTHTIIAPSANVGRGPDTLSPTSLWFPSKQISDSSIVIINADLNKKLTHFGDYQPSLGICIDPSGFVREGWIRLDYDYKGFGTIIDQEPWPDGSTFTKNIDFLADETVSLTYRGITAGVIVFAWEKQERGEGRRSLLSRTDSEALTLDLGQGDSVLNFRGVVLKVERATDRSIDVRIIDDAAQRWID